MTGPLEGRKIGVGYFPLFHVSHSTETLVADEARVGVCVITINVQSEVCF